MQGGYLINISKLLKSWFNAFCYTLIFHLYSSIQEMSMGFK